MRNDLIFQRVRRTLSEVTGVEDSKITLRTRLQEDLNVDSLSAVEIMTSVAEQFSLKISQRGMFDITTVAEIVDFIKRNIKPLKRKYGAKSRKERRPGKK